MKLLSTYKFRILFAVVTVTTMIIAVISCMGIRGIKKSAIEFFSEEGTRLVNDAWDTIEIDRWEQLSKSLDKEDPYYEDLNEFMFDVREKFACSYLYTMAPTGKDNEAVYVVDGSVIIDEENEDFSPIGTVEDLSSYGSAPWNCMEKKEVCTGPLIHDEAWGWSISVYKPIINQNGDSIGFVAADFDATSLHKTIFLQTLVIIIIAAAGEILAVAVLLAILLVFFHHMEKIVRRMEEISGGGSDLTARIPVSEGNELGQLSKACNSVIETIQNMVKTVSTSVDDLYFNSAEIVEQSQKMTDMLGNAENDLNDITGKATNQSELTEKMNQEIEAFKNSIILFRNKVNEQVEAVNQSSTAVEEITANIDSTGNNISRIKDEYDVIVSDTNSHLANQKILSEQIEKIQEMAKNLTEANKIITNIASQTNLLAMNAAIEAAHAGEAGSGFSVVAEEIRNLAETSANQTKSIKDIVSKIEAAVGDMVSSSNRSEKAFENLGQKVGNLQYSVQEIQRGMEEQSAGAKQILDMMRVLSSASGEMSNASDKMNSETNEIAESMSRIKSSSAEILSSSGSSLNMLQQIKVFAEESAGSSHNNQNLSQNVKNVVGSYKVEE